MHVMVVTVMELTLIIQRILDVIEIGYFPVVLAAKLKDFS
jgi:hypothetical protein